MHELRILSGLHRGATLPLHDDALTIGASDDADVVLVDPSITEQHATLSRTAAGWLLSTGGGALFDAGSNREQTVLDLLPGDFARVGEVWIAIVEQDAAWTGAPAQPQDEPMMDELMMDEPMMDEPCVAAEVQQAAPAAPAPRPVPGRSWRAARIALGLLGTTVVLSTAAAFTMTTAAPLPAQRPAALDAALAAETKTAATPEALRKALRKRLADAELLQQFDLTLGDDAWQMQGALDDEEARRFDLLLRAFISEHHITFPVHAKIVSHEGMLPFKISQVISGANPNIVTQEGQRLFVGEEFRGMRLVAIQDNHLTFAGKRKIEVNW